MSYIACLCLLLLVWNIKHKRTSYDYNYNYLLHILRCSCRPGLAIRAHRAWARWIGPLGKSGPPRWNPKKRANSGRALPKMVFACCAAGCLLARARLIWSLISQCCQHTYMFQHLLQKLNFDLLAALVPFLSRLITAGVFYFFARQEQFFFSVPCFNAIKGRIKLEFKWPYSILAVIDLWAVGRSHSSKINVSFGWADRRPNKNTHMLCVFNTDVQNAALHSAFLKILCMNV